MLTSNDYLLLVDFMSCLRNCYCIAMVGMFLNCVACFVFKHMLSTSFHKNKASCGLAVSIVCMQVSKIELPSRRVLQFRDNLIGMSTVSGGGNSPTGAHVLATHDNCVAPNETALRVRTSAGGLKLPQATMMIATAYTQPMIQTPRDLLQLPPALQLDSNPSDNLQSDPAQADLVQACAKVAPAVQKLPPTRFRRRTARAAALHDSLHKSCKGSPVPEQSSTAAIPLTACRQFDLKRGRCSSYISGLPSRHCLQFPAQ